MSRHWLSITVLIASCADLRAEEVDAQRGRPLIVAHRGLLHHAPENTLANFRACLELRIGFEFDVQRTRDGRLVCIHDDTVDRTTNGTGNVRDLTFEEIRRLDAGDWFGPRFRGEVVPTVAEVLDLLSEYRARDVLVAVDLKAEGCAADVVRLANAAGVMERLLFIGRTIGDAKVRRRLRTASPEAPIAVVAHDSGEFAVALVDRDADWIYVRYLPSKAEVDKAHQARERVFIAGKAVSGREPENWKRASAAGVDAILTDYPLELRPTLRKSARPTRKRQGSAKKQNNES